MNRLIFGLVLLLAPLACGVARAQTDQQDLVDRATLSVQEMSADTGAGDVHGLMKHAKGAMICPRVFKLGFFLGGQGGGCVLVGRGDKGWTDPAFYGMGAGSFGLQFGVQDSQILFIILTEKGLRALLDSQFKIGANADIAIATFGGGIQGSTTAALNADIVAYSKSRGLFAGVALDGSLIGARTEWNQAYYGQPLAAQNIVLQNQGNNPGAEPLKEMLSRLSG